LLKTHKSKIIDYCFHASVSQSRKNSQKNSAFGYRLIFLIKTLGESLTQITFLSGLLIPQSPSHRTEQSYDHDTSACELNQDFPCLSRR